MAWLNGHIEHDWFNRPVPKNVRLGSNVYVESAYEFAAFFSEQDPGITMEEGSGAWGAVINAGVQIGRGSVVGCKTIITQDVPPYSVMVGNPARLLFRPEPDNTPEMRRAALEEFGLAPLVAHDRGREHTN